MVLFSELTKERFNRFKRIRRAYYSLWILSVAFVLSLFSHFLVNDKPLILQYKNSYYSPVLFFYPSSAFGGRYRTEADYLALEGDRDFQEDGGWMLFPPVPHSPLHSYLAMDGTPPHRPSGTHWLGTDSMARDILSRLFHGFRICMLFALTLTFLSAFFGIVIGGIQGYFAGKVDIVFQRFIEIWSSLPFLYVVILLGSIFGRSFGLLVMVMLIFQWIGLSYYMRGEFLKIKNMNYIRAAHAAGMSHARIFFRHILPNALTPIITIMPFSLIGGISTLTALDFLGFGLQPPTPSWGELLDQGLKNLHAPWITVSTVTALFITLLLATFIGEGVREAMDPKSGDRFE
ncbi:MAG: ABC transporter permease [Proteobacteria bacterium]|nr:ABC transporter permease [Pseudomonadota bacterium]